MTKDKVVIVDIRNGQEVYYTGNNYGYCEFVPDLFSAKFYNPHSFPACLGLRVWDENEKCYFALCYNEAPEKTSMTIKTVKVTIE